MRNIAEIRFDLMTWLTILDRFNGIVYIPDAAWLSSDTLLLYTDSAGSPNLGSGCFFFYKKWAFFSIDYVMTK